MSTRAGAVAPVIVEDESAPKAPLKPCCASCPRFSNFDVAKLAAIQKMGGAGRGDCTLDPVIVKKQPDEVCGHHPALRAEDAQILAKAFAPLVDALTVALVNAAHPAHVVEPEKRK